MRSGSIFGAVLAILLCTPAWAMACLHAGGAGPESEPVGQSGQQAIVLHHDGIEDLIIRVQYAGRDLSALGWIIPVPSVPSHYAVTDPSLFEQIDGWVRLQRQMPAARSMGAKSAGAGEPAVRLLPAASAGPFEIQPVQGGAKALNSWLEANGFQPLPPAQLTYYAERKWTFLAVRIAPGKGQSHLGASGGLPPLHIRFASSRAVYPLKLSTHGGEFAARVYLITADALPDGAFDGARQRGFEVVNERRYLPTPTDAVGRLHSPIGRFAAATAPDALDPLLKARFPDATKLSLSVLFSGRVNRTDVQTVGEAWKHVQFAPATWTEDLSVPGVGPGERLEQR